MTIYDSIKVYPAEQRALAKGYNDIHGETLNSRAVVVGQTMCDIGCLSIKFSDTTRITAEDIPWIQEKLIPRLTKEKV